LTDTFADLQFLVPCAPQKQISKDLEMEKKIPFCTLQNRNVWFIMLRSKEWVLFQVTPSIVIRYTVQFVPRLVQKCN